MNLQKIFWVLRVLLYKPFLGKVGLPSYMGKPIYLSNPQKIFLGSRVRIYPGMRAETVGDGAKIVIGNNISIGQNFHVVSYCHELTIGDDTTVAGNVFITNCDHDYKGENNSVLENNILYKKTSVGKGCFIGNNVAILSGTKLGDGCIVGTNAVLKGDYPANSVIVGVPGKVIKRYTKEKSDDTSKN